MGFGDTAKRIQTLADRAEQLIAQLKDVRERVINLEEATEETNHRVSRLEKDSEKQLVLLKELAREQGIDADEVLAQAAIEEAESDDEAEDAAESPDGEASTSESDSAEQADDAIEG